MIALKIPHDGAKDTLGNHFDSGTYHIYRSRGILVDLRFLSTRLDNASGWRAVGNRTSISDACDHVDSVYCIYIVTAHGFRETAGCSRVHGQFNGHV